MIGIDLLKINEVCVLEKRVLNWFYWFIKLESRLLFDILVIVVGFAVGLVVDMEEEDSYLEFWG